MGLPVACIQIRVADGIARMDHHPVPHIDTTVGNAACIIGALKKDQIAGAGRAGGGADVVKPLGPQAAHIPAGTFPPRPR